MAKSNQRSRKNPKRRAAVAKQKERVDKAWIDESSSIPEDFTPEPRSGVIILTSEAEWIRDTVQSHFKRAEHGLTW